MSAAGDFWSRRRARVAAEQEAAERQALVQEQADIEADARDKTDEEILQELELPDPDTLTSGDDFSVFMKNAVPERLRRRALRALWRTNPVLANVDGLVDYGEDFTDAATVVENLSTTYQVGKGMLQHVIAQAEAAERALQAEAEGEEAEPLDEDAPEPVAPDPAEAGLAEPDEAPAPEPAPELAPQPAPDMMVADAPDTAMPVRRRMKFEFTEDHA